MITDEDKCFYRESDDQFIFQHEDGRFYTETEIDGINSEYLIWDEDHQVYFITRSAWDWVVDFIKLKGFEPYEPFVG
jgi:hypothetical protein